MSYVIASPNGATSYSSKADFYSSIRELERVQLEKSRPKPTPLTYDDLERFKEILMYEPNYDYVGIYNNLKGVNKKLLGEDEEKEY